MPLIINTNVPSLRISNSIRRNQSSLETSLLRLSTGLRINSAADDPAGFVMSNRLETQVTSYGRVLRNVNDGLSLTGLADNSLSAMSSQLQRAKEISLQSSNGTLTTAERDALGVELNQIKVELSRIVSAAKFNGKSLLDGSLNGLNLQVGINTNDVYTINLQNSSIDVIGSNQALTNNTNGLESATRVESLAGGTSGVNVGTEVGVASSTANNGYSATVFTITNTDSTGSTINNTLAATSANASAETIATQLTAANGVSATGFNQVVINNLSNFAVSTGFTLNGQSILDTGATLNLSNVATQINSNATLQSQGIYATLDGSNINVFAVTGADLSFALTGVSGESIDVTSSLDTNGATALTAGNQQTRGGRVDIYLDQGFSITSDNGTIIPSSGQAAPLGLTSIAAGNNNGAQTLAITGSDGSASIVVTQGQSAISLANAINEVSATTGVTASSRTVAQLDSLSADGTVAFTLFGDNTTGVSISAAVTTTDLSNLVTAINDNSGATGITASIGSSNGQITLNNSNGNNIAIENFSHSAAQDLQNPATTPVVGDGSATPAATSVSLSVTGNPDSNTGGLSVSLIDGGAQTLQDSTVVGGQVTLNSAAAFTASSSIDGTGQSATSLFALASNASLNSTLASVADTNISSAANAQLAIDVLDLAITSISLYGARAGATFNNLQSAATRVASTTNELDIAKSRITDTDFALETANLTRSQIISQAAISVLTQANALQQNVLALLVPMRGN